VRFIVSLNDGGFLTANPTKKRTTRKKAHAHQFNGEKAFLFMCDIILHLTQTIAQIKKEEKGRPCLGSERQW